MIVIFIMNLPKDYVLPEELTNLDSETWTTLLSYIASIYSSIKNSLHHVEEKDVPDAIIIKLNEQTNTITTLNHTYQQLQVDYDKMKYTHELTYNTKLNQLENSYKHQIEELTTSHQLQQLSTTRQLETDLQTKYEQKLQQLQQKIDELNNNKLQDTHNAQTDLQTKYEQKITNTETKYEQKLQQLQQKIDDLNNTKLQDIYTIQADLQTKYEQKIQQLQVELNKSYTYNKTEELDKINNILQDNIQLQNKLTDLTTQLNNIKIEKIELEVNVKKELETQYNNKINAIIKQHKEKISKLHNKHEAHAEKIDNKNLTELTIIKDEFNNKLTHEEARYMEHIQQLKKEHQQELQHYTNTLGQSITHTLDTSFQKIDQALEPIKKYAKGGAVEKGISGEERVYQLLMEYYEKGQILRTAKEANKGDLWFIHNGIRYLIEVKNKKEITQLDIQKFISNVDTNNEITCGLFISLETPDLLNRRDYIYQEFIREKPVIYIYLEYPILLKYAISLLHTLNILHASINNKDKEQQSIKKIININYTSFMTGINHITRINKLVISLHNQVGKCKTDLMNQLDYMGKFFESNPTYKDVSAKDTKTDNTHEIYTPEELNTVIKYMHNHQLNTISREKVCAILKVSRETYKDRNLGAIFQYIKTNYNLPKYTDTELKLLDNWLSNNTEVKLTIDVVCKILKREEHKIIKCGGLDTVLSEYKNYTECPNRWDQVYGNVG